MLTEQEQDAIVLEGARRVKDCLFAVCGKRLTKKNFRKVISEALDKGVKGYAGTNITRSQAIRLKAFFDSCKDYLAPIVADYQSGNLKISVTYDNLPLCNWTAPIGMFFDNQERCNLFIGLICSGFRDSILSCMLAPETRRLIQEGDSSAIKFMYESFNRPSGESALNNLVMMRTHFPEFYEHITKKLDVMTVEQMSDHIKDRNSLSK